MQDHLLGLQPVAFLSKVMTKEQQGYPKHEQKLLALMIALEEWRHYVLQLSFTVWTDHHPPFCWGSWRSVCTILKVPCVVLTKALGICSCILHESLHSSNINNEGSVIGDGGRDAVEDEMELASPSWKALLHLPTSPPYSTSSSGVPQPCTCLTTSHPLMPASTF